MNNFAPNVDLLTFDLYPRVQDTKEILKLIKGRNLKETFVVYLLDKDAKMDLNGQIELLRKIFGALKFDLDNDIIHLDATKDGVACFNEVEKLWPIKFFVSFGVSPKILGLNINVRYYQPIKLGDTVMVFSECLSEVGQKKEKKLALWKALQATFLKD